MTNEYDQRFCSELSQLFNEIWLARILSNFYTIQIKFKVFTGRERYCEILIVKRGRVNINWGDGCADVVGTYKEHGSTNATPGHRYRGTGYYIITITGDIISSHTWDDLDIMRIN
jgi:hypothetical protein